MRIDPDVGSMIRLIIFMVVVFPHPEGPTNMTSSPGRMSMVKSSTAGALCPGYTFETSRRLSEAPPAPSAVVEIAVTAVAVESGTEPP